MNKFIKKLFHTKETHVYRKTHRRHRRELVKLAKETYEWDWGWLHDSVIMQIRHMYEYFSDKNNVWQADESRLQVVEQLKHVLDLNEELNNLWENYESHLIHHEDGSVSVSDEGSKQYNAIKDREQELYEEIYSYIGKYIQWWWD